MDSDNKFVIHSYTDKEAVEDGTLIAISDRDRVTNAAFEFLAAHTPMDAKPPNNWPVDMLGWFRLDKKAPEQKQREQRAVALAKGLLARDGRKAREVYEKNTNGGIYQVWAKVNHLDGVLSGLTSDETYGWARLWILPNENNGLTLMFPEDY